MWKIIKSCNSRFSRSKNTFAIPKIFQINFLDNYLFNNYNIHLNDVKSICIRENYESTSLTIVLCDKTQICKTFDEGTLPEQLEFSKYTLNYVENIDESNITCTITQIFFS